MSMTDGIDRTPDGQKASLSSESFNMARQRMRAKTLKIASLPHVGIWYWVFLAPDWRLFTWDFPI